MRVLSFNGEASEALGARKGGKLRLDVKDDVLMVRPTDRKAGPHVLTEMVSKDGGIRVEVQDKQMEKLVAGALLADTLTYGLRADKYGWFSLVAEADGQDGTKVVVSDETA